MTNLRGGPISFADSPAIDAFGRLRVGEATSVFDSNLLFGKNTDVWDEHINDVSGSAASTFATNKVTMAVGANAADRVIRQTKMRFAYLPGKSHLLFATFVLGNDSGTTKRVGYFNTSTASPYTANRDGIYLEHDGTDVYFVQSKDGVTTNTRIAQSSWNIDTFDGTGPSNITIDWSDAQIMIIDMEYLGVGRVRCGFVINGLIYYAHEFLNANGVIQAITEPYIDSPNHSVRYEIYSDGSAGSLVAICCSVQSEGGYRGFGTLYGASRGATLFDAGNDINVYPVLSLRLRADRPGGSIFLESLSIVCQTKGWYRWSIILNPTIGGTDQASWTNVGGNSAVQYDISRDDTNTLTGGTTLETGYRGDDNVASGGASIPLGGAVRPGIGIDGTQDEIILAVQTTPASDEAYFGSLNWREPL
jgi:hypothetical protein